MEKPGYYAIIPASVRYADIPPNSKLLYGEVSALSNKNGYCTASNGYFAELYTIKPQSASRLINILVKGGFITSHLIYKADSKEIEERRLYLNPSVTPQLDLIGGIPSNVKDNITSNLFSITDNQLLVNGDFVNKVLNGDETWSVLDPNINYKAAETVQLKGSDLIGLISSYGLDNTRKIIDKLDAYQLNKKPYKSAIGAIRSWVADAVVGDGKPKKEMSKTTDSDY